MTGAKLAGWVDVPYRNDTATMQALIQHGPLAVAFNVGAATLYYDSGVIDAAECEQNAPDQLNHAINLVGFGTSEDGVDYWLLRNSWSTYWGDEGYFKVKRGARDCGVTSSAGFPVLSTSSSGDVAAVSVSSQQAQTLESTVFV